MNSSHLKSIAWFVAVFLWMVCCLSGSFYLIHWLDGLNWLYWLPGALLLQLLTSLIGIGLFVLSIGLFSSSMRKKQNEFFGSISDALKRIAKGDFSVSLETSSNWGRGEMRDIIQNINEMAVDLGRLEEMRQEFISNVSHEIQSPLTSISGFAKVLKDGDLSPEQRERYLDIIEQESVRLSRLSEHMLRLASLDSDQHPFHPEKLRLDKQLQTLILASEPQWMDKELEVSAELEPLAVEIDRDLLSQVWVNLLHNAIKFTPDRGMIRIALKQEGEEAVVSVEDSGIGMSEESLDQIFERFYKADKSRTRSGGGSGLGLSISRKIVQMHQGTIEVRSRLGEGTVMMVRLPLRQE